MQVFAIPTHSRSAFLGSTSRVIARLVIPVALLFVFVCATGSVQAQDAAATPNQTASRTAPVLRDFVQAERPENTRYVRAEVTLVLTLDAAGVVTQADVASSTDERFNAFAASAAQRFGFVPAMRDGTAVPSRIRYVYVFEVEEPIAIPADPFGESSAALSFSLQNSTGEEVLAGVHVRVENAEGALLFEGDTDAAGTLRAEDLDVGDVTITLDRDGYVSRTVQQTLEAGVEFTLTYSMESETPETTTNEVPLYEATATAPPPPRDAIRRELTRDVLTRMPGTRGDALRVVELLPGVGRPSFGAGALIVRGAAPGDSQVFLSGSAVPLLYHFGGLTSFYSSQLLDRIDFVPGNFSVRYGRKIGGILEVDPRDPRTDGVHGYADINLIDGSIMIEAPLDRHFSFAIAARRSYIDFFLDAIIPRDSVSFTAAPVYYDYQGIAVWRPNSRDRIRFLLYGSSDELRLVLSGASDSDPAVRGNIGVATQFHRGQLEWRHVFDENLQVDTMLSGGVNDQRFNLGDSLSFAGRFYPITLRSEWKLRLSETVRWVAGIDWQYTPLDLRFIGPPSQGGEGTLNGGSLSGSDRVNFGTNRASYRPGVYFESQLHPIEPLDVVIGTRVDYYREIESWTVDPRMTGRWKFDEHFALRAGLGLFSQPPEVTESAQLIGNPDLRALHAVHVGVGADLRIPEENFSLTLDGFYKHIYDRVVGTPNNAAPFFENGGLGRIYGLEVGARLMPGGKFPVFGFLSYTLSRSERLDYPDANGQLANGQSSAWRLFDFDQTHIFTLAAVWAIGSGWEAGLTFRLVSGNPYTPILTAINNLNTGIYQPIYGPTNSGRNPLFHRLDVRVQKRFSVGDGSILLYLDIQNVYNQPNQEGVAYSYDYSQQATISGLPIIPSLGIRGEL